MTEPLRVDPAALVREAANFERITDGLKDVLTSVRSTANAMNGLWRGSAAEATQRVIQEFEKAAEAQVRALNDISTNVQTAAARYSTTDDAQSRALASQMGMGGNETEHGVTPDSAVHLVDFKKGPPLHPGDVDDEGPVAGTDAKDGGIPGIGAADLGEVVQLPNGKYVALFGDSFSGDKMGAGEHYPSVAVPVTFDEQGHPHFGAPLTGPDGSPHVLFPPPPEAAGTDTLPAGSIQMRDGSTYVMVAGTKHLQPTGGSWLVKTTDEPSTGWKPIEGSWRAGDYADAGQSQISGYQGSDGNVYIAADSFNRSQGVTMYKVAPDQVTNRAAWQPWTGNSWGAPGQTAAQMSPDRFGELSFREIDGKPVLSGFNESTGNTEVRVADSPTSIFNGAPTVAARGGEWGDPGVTSQNYGGYILPGSTLDKMNLFVSQWNNTHEPLNTPYNVQEFQVNVNH